MVFFILIWAAYWAIVWGIFHLFNAKFNYIKRFIITSIYFLLFGIIPLLYYYDKIINYLATNLALPLIFIVVFYLFAIFFYDYLKNNYSAQITNISKKNPDIFAFRADYRYLFSKSFDIFFQQALILCLSLYLFDYFSKNIFVLLAAFSAIFGIVHIPLFYFGKKNNKKAVFIVASFFSALVFPTLIVLFKGGVFYSFCVHWLFYMSYAAYYIIKN